VKRNTNSVLMNFQKTASVVFYVNVKYVSIHHNNRRNDNEVIDITGHNRPPVIDQNTLSLSLSDVLSLSLSDNSSRSLTSVRLKTNSDGDSLFPS
jgi:hypothetical protein